MGNTKLKMLPSPCPPCMWKSSLWLRLPEGGGVGWCVCGEIAF